MNCSEWSFQTFLYYRVKNLSFSRCLNYQLNSPTPCPFFRGKPNILVRSNVQTDSFSRISSQLWNRGRVFSLSFPFWATRPSTLGPTSDRDKSRIGRLNRGVVIRFTDRLSAGCQNRAAVPPFHWLLAIFYLLYLGPAPNFFLDYVSG